ncbi:hypothetical protein B0H19DRAFT_435213 [Mycena capillaripes]|nr:hypothetical protein B0H19DRAFT_435213 [Mycena capillaripes]
MVRPGIFVLQGEGRGCGGRKGCSWCRILARAMYETHARMGRVLRRHDVANVEMARQTLLHYYAAALQRPLVSDTPTSSLAIEVPRARHVIEPESRFHRCAAATTPLRHPHSRPSSPAFPDPLPVQNAPDLDCGRLGNAPARSLRLAERESRVWWKEEMLVAPNRGKGNGRDSCDSENPDIQRGGVACLEHDVANVELCSTRPPSPLRCCAGVPSSPTLRPPLFSPLKCPALATSSS